MLNYLLYRILLFIPMLLFISLAAFVLTLQAPDDPVDLLIGSQQAYEVDMRLGRVQLEDPMYLYKREEKRKQLHLDLPVFYFSLHPLAVPDSLYKIPHRKERAMLHALVYQYGHWPHVQAYYRSLKTLYKAHERDLKAVGPGGKFTTEESKQIGTSVEAVKALLQFSDPLRIEAKFQSLQQLFTSSPTLAPLWPKLEQVITAWKTLQQQPACWKLYVPDFSFYGSQNQYHKWLIGVLTRLDFGESFTRKTPVGPTIRQKMWWSFWFALLSSLLAYLISIPLGVWTAMRQHSRWDKGIQVGLFALDAIPSFWMAYLLILLFANADLINLFPATFNDHTHPLVMRMLLPLFAYTYGGLAFLSRQVRGNMLEVIQQEYILAARARGIPERRIWLRHALKNAALPLITIFGTFFPALVGGSVILEHIFAIPGMGDYVLEVISSKDLPVIVATFTLLGGMTMVGYLVSDILYHLVDPRIRFSKTN